MLVDSHCHIPMIERDGGVDVILESALKNGIQHMLCVSVDLENYPQLHEMVRQHDCLSASVGIHPNTQVEVEPSFDELVELAMDRHVVGIGETGLDYFRSEGDLEWQRARFRLHIRVAKAVKKPLIIHCRNAKEDVLRILEEEQADTVGGVMHCFVEDWETAQRAMTINFRISFSGIVTFRNALELKEVAKLVPDNMLLIETDSPYLAPVPYRGKQNEPAYVRHVAEHIAQLRETSFEHIAKISTDNYFKLFTDAKRH